MNNADLVITGANVVTMDSERRILAHADVVIREDRIIAVEPTSTVENTERHKTIDAAGKVLLPGFINTHCHCTHNLMRGGPSDDLHVGDWVVNALFPALKAYTSEDSRIAAQLYCMEAIRSGITTTVDIEDYARIDTHFEQTIAAYEEFGLRIIYGDSFFEAELPSWSAMFKEARARHPEIHHDEDVFETTNVALDRIEKRIKSNHGKADGRIQLWPAPNSLLMNTKEGILGARDLAKRYGLRLPIHVAETRDESNDLGCSSVAYLDSLGFWDEDVLAAKMIFTDSDDHKILQRHDVKIAHDLATNMLCGYGIAPVFEYLEAGLTVGIGIDDVNLNQSVNLIADMRMVAAAQKAKYEDPTVITAEKVLEMATIDGAHALGMENDIGSIEVGKKADLILVDLKQINTAPCHNVASAIVYHAYGNEVDTTVVDGQILMEGRQLVALSDREQELAFIDNVQAASNRVLERAGMQELRDRPWTSSAHNSQDRLQQD